MWSAERHGRVTVLTYTRPPQNLLGFADLAELDQVLLHWADDERTRVIVLTGGLPGYFAAHADLADVAALVHGTATGPHGPGVWRDALARIAAIPQPVIAAINGQAWGGGLELALSCLMRAASPAAHFRFPEVAAGAIPGAGGTQRLPRLIGLPQAARLVLGGETITAHEALRTGLIDIILPGEEFLNAVLDWAAPLAAQPRHSLAAAKYALQLTASLPLDQGITHEQEIFRTTLTSPQTQAMHAQPASLADGFSAPVPAAADHLVDGRPGTSCIPATRRPLGSGAEVGPVLVVPYEPARLREDAALPLLDVHGAELHGAGGVEQTAVSRFQDGETGPPQVRVEGEGPRTG